MTKIKTTDFDVICEYQNCWIDQNGYIIPFIYNNIELEILENFNKEQKNKCFDWIKKNKCSISDWLIVQGYILVENFKANYYVDKEQRPSEKQCEILSCILYNNNLIDKYSKLGKNVLKKSFKYDYKFKQKYYDKILPHARNIFSPILNK